MHELSRFLQEKGRLEAAMEHYGLVSDYERQTVWAIYSRQGLVAALNEIDNKYAFDFPPEA